MRAKINQMVHVYEGNLASVIYKGFMIFVLVISLIPLTMKNDPPFFKGIEIFCLVVFIVDFLLRWMTADYKFKDKSFRSFLRYPFRLISIVDLMSIFALLSSINGWFYGYKIAEVLVVFRIIRVFRYSKSVRTILGILRSSKKPLAAVGGLAVGYILISAIIIFNVEPASFETFFDAVYWATVSLTTVGYGDIYPVTMIGRTVAMLSSFFGIAIVALPAGIVTAEYIESLKVNQNKD